MLRAQTRCVAPQCRLRIRTCRWCHSAYDLDTQANVHGYNICGTGTGW